MEDGAGLRICSLTQYSPNYCELESHKTEDLNVREKLYVRKIRKIAVS